MRAARVVAILLAAGMVISFCIIGAAQLLGVTTTYVEVENGCTVERDRDALGNVTREERAC